MVAEAVRASLTPDILFLFVCFYLFMKGKLISHMNDITLDAYLTWSNAVTPEPQKYP